MAWKFNNIEIETVIDADYALDEGKITLTCYAEGSTEIENVAFITDEWRITAVNDNQKYNLGNFTVVKEEAEKFYIQPGVSDFGLNGLQVLDYLIVTVNDYEPFTVQFGTNNNISSTTRIEITDLLDIGSNIVTIEVQGTTGTYLGSSAMYIVKRTGNDPRDVIKVWQGYESKKSSNVWTIEGRKILQATDTRAYQLEDFRSNWTAVLDSVTWVEDSKSNQLILYKLVFLTGQEALGSKYGLCYTAGETGSGFISIPYMDVDLAANYIPTEIGSVIIQKEDPINSISIYGGGIDLPSWIEVNGVRKYWHYKYDDAIEKMIFGPINDTLAIITSPNYQGSNPTSYYGTKVKAICIDQSTDSMGLLQSKTYNPPFSNYSNIEIYAYTNQTNPTGTILEQATGNYYPATVEQVSGTNRFEWNDINNIKTSDGSFATCYNNSTGVGSTYFLEASNFGLNIPLNATVKRLECRVRNANSSVIRSPTFTNVSHYMTWSGPGFSVSGSQNYNVGTTNANMQDHWFDSAYNMPSVPTDPSKYNDPTFKVRYSATLDTKKTCWIDYIYVYIIYTVPEVTSTTYNGTTIGYMKLEEDRNVNHVSIIGAGDTPPVSIAVNGLWQNVLKYTNAEPKGKVSLGFDIVPSKTIEIQTSSSTASDKHGFIIDKIVVFYE